MVVRLSLLSILQIGTLEAKVASFDGDNDTLYDEV